MTKTEMREYLRYGRYFIGRDVVEADHAEAITLDPEARELDIFRTEAARHLSGVELVEAVDAYADDLRKRTEHANDCDSCSDDTDVLAIVSRVGVAAFRAAVERGSAITSVAELDARAAELSPHGGWHRIVAGLGGSLCDRCDNQIETPGGCQSLTCVCWCRASDMAWYSRTE